MRLGETKEFNASDGFDNGKEDDFFCKGCECGNWHTKEVTDQLSMQEFQENFHNEMKKCNAVDGFDNGKDEDFFCKGCGY